MDVRMSTRNRHRLPTMPGRRLLAEAGRLMSYGMNVCELCPHSAAPLDKTLKGARPADLPVKPPTKFELVIHLKTAQALGLTMPLTLLFQADEVIQ
jgi:putative tryptophan/tyrosine transport system substrate-binding protein